MGRSFLRDDCAYSAIGFNTEIWKGAYASVRPSEMGLTLNLDSKWEKSRLECFPISPDLGMIQADIHLYSLF